MKRGVGERVLFLRSFVAHPRQVGAILPTSRSAVRDMLDLTSFADARCVLEFGAGTGVYTREILARLRPDGRLLAFEVDSNLASTLADQFQDSRLQVINDSAENVKAYLNGVRADRIVSGLPFTSLPANVRHNIFERSREVLASDGVMLVLQYSPLIQPELKRRFASVRRRISLLNVPPAFLFACEQPQMTSGQGAR